jgi:CRISPR-associated endonuclease/helicase Cas3
MKYYAHSKPEEPAENWQPLEEHLANVAEMSAKFANAFESKDWAHNASWIHDLGKADSSFQGYLLRSNGLDDSDYDSGTVNHSSAGAAFSEEKLGNLSGRILAYLSAGHHAGLPDWHSSDTGNAALSIRLNEGKENLLRIKTYSELVLEKLRATPRPPSFVKSENFHFWMRFLYSCLVDADFLDTESFMAPNQAVERAKFAILSELKIKFDRYMDEFANSAEKTPVNAIRKKVLSACRSAANNPNGLFSLTVPTGGGKTLSSIAFALDHAEKNGKSRIIYVIPYTSIIEQTAKTLGNIFGSENVVEHHSNFDTEKETQSSRLASENWDAPIVVTTNVQFFESLYAAKSSRCRKLHNLVNSVVVLDEAQLLPPELLDPCVKAINELTMNYGVTIVLATATQPALPNLIKPTEIIPSEYKLYEHLKRTNIGFPENLNEPSSWAEIATHLKQHEQVLCIVNTRKDCHELYSLMPENTIHLSALMCGEHRSRIIRYIKWRLKKKKAIRVISTQLVEAGVDIDFPVVFRAIAGLASIAQAAGRCNREGKLSKHGEVRVFISPKPAPIGLLRKGEDKTRELASSPNFNPDCPEIFTKYFNLFYGAVNETGVGKLHEQLVKDVNPDIYIQFRTYANEFKLIDDKAQRPVIVRYGKSEKTIKELQIIGPTRDNMRKLQRYTVNLSVWMIDKMKNDGLLEETRNGILIQTMPNLYSDKIGFDIYRETLPAEDLIQ